MPPGNERRAAYARLNEQIGRNNVKTIDRCDGVFAILDGVDVDSGTAADGYAFAKGKPIVGYRSDFRLAADNEGAARQSPGRVFHPAAAGRDCDDAGGCGETLVAAGLRAGDDIIERSSRVRLGGRGRFVASGNVQCGEKRFRVRQGGPYEAGRGLRSAGSTGNPGDRSRGCTFAEGIRAGGRSPAWDQE